MELLPKFRSYPNLKLKSLKESLNQLSFKALLACFFAVISIFAIVIFSIISYVQAIDVLQKDFVKNSAAIFKNIRNDLVSKLNNIENTLKFIASDQRLQNLNRNGAEITNRQLADFFADCIDLNNYTTRSESHFLKNLVDELIFYSKQRVVLTRRNHFSVYGIERYLNPDLLSQAKAAQGRVIWSGVFFNELGSQLMLNLDEAARREELNQFAVIKQVTDEQYKTEIGYLIASINLAGLSDLVEDVQLGDTGRVYLINQDLKVLAGWDKELIMRSLPLDQKSQGLLLRQTKEGNLQGDFKGVKSYIHFEEIGVNGWKLIGVINNREFQTKAKLIRDRIFIDGLVIIGILILATIVVANRITKPLRNICSFLGEVEAGDLTIRTNERGSAEIQNLAAQINRMIERINLLMKQIYQEQRFKRKVALKALHDQINPHFLYNTLESISWMIETGKRKVAVMLIESLSNFFRLGLSGGRDIVTIGAELEHAESYLKIQQVRYQDRLDYVIDVDDEIKNEYITKITLQPLIENGIYHGIKLKNDGPGRIYISGGRQGEFIKLEVVDNGAGMGRDQLAALEKLLAEPKLDPETSGKGYSIRNINTRIKLHFGKEYGLNYSSKEGIGTRVEVILPVNWNPNGSIEENAKLQ
jgi:sensor histidine kinase YesM